MDIQDSDLSSFAGTLRQFITSESLSMKGEQCRCTPLDKPRCTHALWPLVKVVQIYCNAPALSSGAILVDLPGSADTNKARSGVAAKYMQYCHHVWVVMDIKRAVDDQNAKGAQTLGCASWNRYAEREYMDSADILDQASPMQFLRESPNSLLLTSPNIMSYSGYAWSHSAVPSMP